MIKKAILLLFLTVSAHAATYYISPTGNDSTGAGTNASPWLTLAEAFDNMSGGDTLIIKDGTYSGADNVIDVNQMPPVGSAGAWTIIKAEHDGAAIFDGSVTAGICDIQYPGTEYHDPRLAYSHPLYFQFEGILWIRGPQFVNSRFIKLLRCGSYDAPDGNATNISFNRCADVLVENCYAYGSGRYKYHIYCSTQVIVRQSVARMDRCNASQNIALFAMYSSVNCEVQNCIGIDSDQYDDYLNVLGYDGTFFVPSTDADALNINFTRCIGVNNDIGGVITAGNYTESINVIFNNCSLVDINSPNNTNQLKGDYGKIENCTFINGTSQGERCFSGETGIDVSMRNSIISGQEADRIIVSFDEDYNNVYNSTATEATAAIWVWCNGSGSYGTRGTHTQQINPIWNASTNPLGAIRYPVRTETGNNLEGDGEGGVNLGANVLKMVGAQGTMWGETGYNVEQTTNMWPFPYEDLIKTKFAAYSVHDATYDVDGDRGFAAEGTQLNGVDDITLTSYIWEYLGNEMPDDIYGEDTSSPTIIGITETVYATSATIVWTTNESANSRVDYGTTTGYGSNVTGAAYSTSHSLTITGLTAETLYHYKITTADSTGNTTESVDGDFTTTAEEEDPEEPATIGITIQGITITGGIEIRRGN